MTKPDKIGYVNHWGKPKPEYTEMELALMEGGHSLEKPVAMPFLKSLNNKQPPNSNHTV